MAIDIPDICYCFKGQYYDVNGFDVEPFEMNSHCKSHLIPDENRIYILILMKCMERMIFTSY